LKIPARPQFVVTFYETATRRKKLEQIKTGDRLHHFTPPTRPIMEKSNMEKEKSWRGSSLNFSPKALGEGKTDGKGLLSDLTLHSSPAGGGKAKRRSFVSMMTNHEDRPETIRVSFNPNLY